MDKTLQSFVEMLEENSNADSVVTESGKTILLVKRIEESIKNQIRKPGEGSIFSKAWKLDELKPSLSKLDPTASTSIYEGALSGAGYDLIAERKDVVPLKKLVGFTEEKKLVESESRRVARVPQHIEKFKTDTVTYKMRSVSLEEAIKDFTQYEKQAQEGTLFILEDIKIGHHVPRWTDDLYVIIPLE